MKVRAQILLKNGLIASAVGVAALLSAGGANAQAGRYPNQQAQLEYQRQAQARQAQNYANQVRLAQELAAKREAYARQQEAARQARNQQLAAQFAESERRNPVNSWQYKAVERAAPVVKFTRDCAFGALGGAAMSGGNPAAMTASCIGVSKGASLQRLVRPEQAY